VNAGRQILVADNGSNSSAGDSTLDVYDLSGDCRSPQLMASLQLGRGEADLLPSPAIGHEGNVSPDGLTYWIGDIVARRYHAVDITNTSKPRLISTWLVDDLGLVGSTVHGLSISNDGNRAYGVVLGFPAPGAVGDPNAKLNNGFVVLDTSEVQQRKPNPKIKRCPRPCSRTVRWPSTRSRSRSTASPTSSWSTKGAPAVGRHAGAKAACAAGWRRFRWRASSTSATRRSRSRWSS
jgi:hypothetical protein